MGSAVKFTNPVHQGRLSDVSITKKKNTSFVHVSMLEMGVFERVAQPFLIIETTVLSRRSY